MQTHGVPMPLAVLSKTASYVAVAWGMWCTVVGLFGGVLPLPFVEIQAHGSLIEGALALFLLAPLLVLIVRIMMIPILLLLFRVLWPGAWRLRGVEQID